MVGGGAGDDLDILLGGAQLERGLGAGEGAGDIEEQAGGKDDGAGRGDLGGQRDAQADLHVGGPQLDAAVGGDDLHPGEGLDRATRRGDPRNRLQLGKQFGGRGGQLHDEYL